MNKITKKEENSIMLCWSFYRFLVDNMARNDTNSFIIAFGLDNKIAYNLAKRDEIEIEQTDIDEFSNVWF